MRILVWQWGRRGAAPRVAADLAAGLDALDGVDAVLSLSRQAEILASRTPPRTGLLVDTYAGLPGLIGRMLQAPWRHRGLVRTLRALQLDVAICAMPAPLDIWMSYALRRAGVPYFVMVHDADTHPGDGYPLQSHLQRALIRGAGGVIALTRHVADRLQAQGLIGDRRLIMASLPPMAFGPPPPQVAGHGGPLRLLFFGRLLHYKGLDLLADALVRLGPRADLDIRIVGQGPDTPELATLAALPGVRVENRWVAEDEVGDIIAWADALVLPYREASQSGVAAAALAAGRWVVATRVGGIAEQLDGNPHARLCEPDANQLAETIGRLVSEPPPKGAALDASAAWREVAAEIVRQGVLF